jgi:hypothetical protein
VTLRVFKEVYADAAMDRNCRIAKCRLVNGADAQTARPPESLRRPDGAVLLAEPDRRRAAGRSASHESIALRAGPPVRGRAVSVRAVLVCHRGQSTAYSDEWTFWADIEEARQAEAELAPCGPQCGVHIVVRLDLEPDPLRWLPSRTRTTSTVGGVDS